MRSGNAQRAIFGLAVALVFASSPAWPEESASYNAYFQGKYLTALQLAEQEAQAGSKEAYTLMGEIYSEGLGVAQDFSKAAEAYTKAAALGDANAQFSLGTFAAEGRGVPKDLSKAAAPLTIGVAMDVPDQPSP